MTSSLMRIAGLSVAIVAYHAASVRAQGKTASWLDEAKPASWNKPGQPIPSAPKVQGTMDPRCKEQARAPQLPADKRVTDRGWDLVGAFQGGWHVLVIRGTASYDGMCRPRQYQDFVFVRGMFAGTLSPQPMDSRTDGALSRVTLQSGTRLTAEYNRYAARDPLCCPSRTTSVLFDIAADAPSVRALSASSAPTQAVAAAASSLEGTSWRLVRFEGGDGKVLTPDDRSKYTLAFSAGGRLAARIDCNRGAGTWKSDGSSVITIGPLALTRAACPPNPLNDQLGKQLGNIRSYVMRDGHLFLALMADGGIYEFEPIK